jgi:hypothetical protein
MIRFETEPTSKLEENHFLKCEEMGPESDWTWIYQIKTIPWTNTRGSFKFFYKKKGLETGVGGPEVLLKNKNWPTTLVITRRPKLQEQKEQSSRYLLPIHTTYPRSSLLWPWARNHPPKGMWTMNTTHEWVFFLVSGFFLKNVKNHCFYLFFLGKISHSQNLKRNELLRKISRFYVSFLLAARNIEGSLSKCF